jgi:hypothetical protein
MNRTALGLAATAVVLAGCQLIDNELPTEPTKAPSGGVLTVPIPSIPLPGTPAPGPTPTPKPGPAPTPTPEPTPRPSPTPTPDPGGCGNPIPPELSRMNVKIHIPGPTRYTLDSTPLVRDRDYCRQVGYTDGRGECAVRPEGAKDREACELLRVGRADDTGRPGPTWYRDGKLCDGTTCENHPDNQYLVWAYQNGYYEACSKDDVCGGVQVNR